MLQLESACSAANLMIGVALLQNHATNSIYVATQLQTKSIGRAEGEQKLYGKRLSLLRIAE